MSIFPSGYRTKPRLPICIGYDNVVTLSKIFKERPPLPKGRQRAQSKAAENFVIGRIALTMQTTLK